MRLPRKNGRISPNRMLITLLLAGTLALQLTGCTAGAEALLPDREHPLNNPEITEGADPSGGPLPALASSRLPVGLSDVAGVDGGMAIETGTETAYGFRKTAWAGCGLDGTVRSVEMYYGIYAEAEDALVRYRAYSHLNGVKPSSAWIARNSSGEGRTIPISEDFFEIDVSQQMNDTYTIQVLFDNGISCRTALYVNNGEAWLVNTSGYSAGYVKEYILSREERIQAIAEQYGVTPGSASGASSREIAYPTYADRGESNRCDTDLWREKAREIVPDDTLADTVKLTLLHDWMTANLSYDAFAADHLGMSRSNFYKLWDGTCNVYNTGTGVCRDFTNILAIMARELGIPCSSLETDSHAWSIVFVDGAWHEIDLVGDIQRRVCGEDVTEITNPEATVCYDDFFTELTDHPLDGVVSAGYCVYSDQFARTGEH